MPLNTLYTRIRALRLAYLGGDDGCYFTAAPEVPVTCAQLYLCLYEQYCECTESGCAAVENFNMTFDATLNLDGDELEGTLIFPFQAPQAVHVQLDGGPAYEYRTTAPVRLRQQATPE